jgi:hypothetical protein
MAKRMRVSERVKKHRIALRAAALRLKRVFGIESLLRRRTARRGPGCTGPAQTNARRRSSRRSAGLEGLYPRQSTWVNASRGGDSHAGVPRHAQFRDR